MQKSHTDTISIEPLARKKACRKKWAALIKKIYEVDNHCYAPVDGNFVVSWNSVVYPIGTEYRDGRWHLCMMLPQEGLAAFGAAFEWICHLEIWDDCRMDDLWLSYQPVDYRIFPMRLFKGLNLISLPIKSGNMDSDDLAELCTGEPSYLRRRNAFSQRWEEEFDPVRDDQGFVMYSDREKWVTFKGAQKEVNLDTIASYLKSGINLVSPPSLCGKGYKGTDILNDLKASNQQVLGIHMFDRRKGAWSSGLPFFNHTTGPSFEIGPGEGHLCHLE
jgi:hypothetical protein